MPWKKRIVEGLHHVGGHALARALRRSKFVGATVLLYHRVLPDAAPADHYVALMGDATASQFESLIRMLKRSFRFSTPRECVERWRAGREVDPYTLILTFDDGYLDNHELLLPVLKKCDVPATVFITTSSIGGQRTLWFQRLFAAINSTACASTPAFGNLPPMPLQTSKQRVAAMKAIGTEQYAHPASEWEETVDWLVARLDWDGNVETERMMDWDQVVELHRSGLVTVGGHTVTHPLLRQCTAEQARRELEECAEELRTRLKTDFLPFSYPHGRMPSDELQAMTRDAGFACAFTGTWEPNTSRTPRYALGRETVPVNDHAHASWLLSGMTGKRSAWRESADAPPTVGRATSSPEYSPADATQA